MKNLTHYRYSCEHAIFNFLKSGDESKLITELSRIETLIRSELKDGDTNKELCFKFGKYDTLVTTLKEIDGDVSLPTSHSNYKFLIERFELVTKDIDTSNELRVYFE